LKIYDVSMMIHEQMMVYKNIDEKRPKITMVKKWETDGINESVISMNVHTGTHIDAPYHMDQNGSTIDQVDPARLMRSCRVLEMTEITGSITALDLFGKEIKKGDFILFKTANSFKEEFSDDFIYLDQSGAAYLTEKGVSGVGIDALGIERGQPGHQTHHLLMDKGIIIIEGLCLGDVPEGEYFMIALPLKIKAADGAPARVVLLEGKEDGRMLL